MKRDAAKILKKALALPTEDRAVLADSLLASLDGAARALASVSAPAHSERPAPRHFIGISDS